MALMADMTMVPPPMPQKVSRWSRFQISSVWVGSMPMMYLAKSAIMPAAASGPEL